MKQLQILCLALVAAAWWWPSAAHAQLDSVSARGRKTLGTIVEMSADSVGIESRTEGKKVFPVNEITSLTYSEEPAGLTDARDAIIRGRFEEAKATLIGLDLQGVTRQVIRQDIEFYRGYVEGRLALAGGDGDKATAARQLLAWIEVPDNRNSYHYYDAVQLLGDLATALGSYANAVKYYDDLAKAPWPEYQVRAAVLTARSLTANNDFAAALQKYDAALQVPGDTPELRSQKLLATVGRAASLAQTGSPDEGMKLVQDVIANNDSSENAELFGRAYNALGDCHLAKSETQAALMAYLHTHLLFNTHAEVHAESLYHLSKLFRDVNKADRALRAKGLLQDRYAGTVWANRQ